MNDTMTISKPQLRAAMLRWEEDYRCGHTRTQAEADAMPIDKLVDESTDALWRSLAAQTVLA